MVNPWDEFADVYDFAAGRFAEDLPFYCKFVRYLPERACVLELLCGTGRITSAILAERNDITVVGADGSDRMLAHLSRRLADGQKRRLQIVKGDITDLSIYPAEFRGRIDLCILGYSDAQLFPPEERVRLFAVVSQLLAPEGLFVFDDSTRSPEELERASGHPIFWRGPDNLTDSVLASATCVDFYFAAERRQRRAVLVDSWPVAGGALHRTSIQLDYFPLSASETSSLLRRAGFRQIEIWEDYVAEGPPLDPRHFGKRSGVFVVGR